MGMIQQRWGKWGYSREKGPFSEQCPWTGEGVGSMPQADGRWALEWSTEGPSTVMGKEAEFMEQTQEG